MRVARRLILAATAALVFWPAAGQSQVFFDNVCTPGSFKVCASAKTYVDAAGKLVIEDRGDTLSLSGEQNGEGENTGDYLRLSGKIVSASRDGFVFVGDITTRVNHIADGAECKRSGTFTFRTKGARKYWRMQEMTNPCDPVTDYVDVYFRGI